MKSNLIEKLKEININEDDVIEALIDSAKRKANLIQIVDLIELKNKEDGK